MSYVGPAIWFLAHYLLTMLVCGGVVWRLVSRRWTDTPQSSDDRRRLQVAIFLIGTALAPFLIGVVQGVLWFTVRHQPLWVYAALQWLWMVAALVMTRRWVRDCRIELLRAVRATRTSSLASCGLLIVLGFVGIQAAYHALGPQRHYDASTYALDARRLAEERSWSALMGHEAADETNQFANHNHGSSYQSFLSASLLYKNPRQDFALRVAQRVLAVHVFVVLIGLGLRLGWAVALLAPLALLTYTYFGTMLSTASRDFYRILPLMFIIGMFRLGGAWPGFNAQGLLIALGFTFLWNSHASSLLIAPTLLACMLVLAPRASSIAALVTGFLISVPLGAMRLLQSFIQTGDPLHDSPLHNLNYLDTAIIAPWLAARGTIPAGPAHALQKLAEQFNNDGKVAVIGLWASVLALVVWHIVRIRTKRSHGDPMLLLAGGFILICLLLLAGVLDGVNDRLSATLAMNPRYRAHWYPLAAIVAGFFIWTIGQGWWKRLPARTMNIVIIVLVAASILPAAGAWKGQSVGQFADTRKGNAQLAARDRWPGLLGCLDPRELVLMDYAYLGWYQTDNRIMFTQDPRLREAFTASDPAQVVRFLDSLGVRYIYLINLEQRAIFESGVALGKAVQSPAYELVFEEPRNWYLYRRVLEKPPVAAPLPAVIGTQPTALAWDVCESLIPVLEDRSLSERAKAVEAILRLGRPAGPAAARLMTMPTNDRARQALREIVGSVESNELSAVQLLDFLKGDTALNWRRPDARSRDQRKGPDFANHLRDLALMRGVSLARPAREFLAMLSQRSFDGHERFVGVDKTGNEHDLLEWVTRSADDLEHQHAIRSSPQADFTAESAESAEKAKTSEESAAICSEPAAQLDWLGRPSDPCRHSALSALSAVNNSETPVHRDAGVNQS